MQWSLICCREFFNVLKTVERLQCSQARVILYSAYRTLTFMSHLVNNPCINHHPLLMMANIASSTNHYALLSLVNLSVALNQAIKKDFAVSLLWSNPELVRETPEKRVHYLLYVDGAVPERPEHGLYFHTQVLDEYHFYVRMGRIVWWYSRLLKARKLTFSDPCISILPFFNSTRILHSIWARVQHGRVHLQQSLFLHVPRVSRDTCQGRTLSFVSLDCWLMLLLYKISVCSHAEQYKRALSGPFWLCPSSLSTACGLPRPFWAG